MSPSIFLTVQGDQNISEIIFLTFSYSLKACSIFLVQTLFARTHHFRSLILSQYADLRYQEIFYIPCSSGSPIQMLLRLHLEELFLLQAFQQFPRVF